MVSSQRLHVHKHRELRSAKFNTNTNHQNKMIATTPANICSNSLPLSSHCISEFGNFVETATQPKARRISNSNNNTDININANMQMNDSHLSVINDALSNANNQYNRADHRDQNHRSAHTYTVHSTRAPPSSWSLPMHNNHNNNNRNHTKNKNKKNTPPLLSLSLPTMLVCVFFCLLIQIHPNSSQYVSNLNCETSASDKFSKYKQSKPLCFKFDGIVDTQGSMFYFTSEVDDFTLISLVGSQLQNTTIWADNQTASVQMEAGNYTSESVIIRQKVADVWYFVPQLTLVVVLNDGAVTEIVWDRGCYTCSSSACIDGSCGFQTTSCTSNVDLCDLKIFVSWYGTDSRGTYLLSAGQRLSQFTGTSASSYYNYVKNNVNTNGISF